MDCLSNPACIFTTVSEAMIHGAAFIDYVGCTIIGDRWDALLPVVEEYSMQLDRLVSMITPRPITTCDPASSLGVLNA